MSSDAVVSVVSDVEKLLMESLSPLDRILLILVFDGNPDGSCGLTGEQRVLLFL